MHDVVSVPLKQLLTEATDAQKRVKALEEQETALKAQVALYTEKYEEFQGTLAKSNEVFASFKSEMEKVWTSATIFPSWMLIFCLF